MRISVCWITKNEEKNIVRSINSLKDHVDEMIVVDTGSDDNTMEAARSLGAKVVSFEWIDDFSAARNYAISLSDGDIIMCPDADMWYDPPFSLVHRDLLKRAFKSPKVEGITATLVDVDTDRGVVLNETSFTLAFKRSAGLSYYNPIHEQLLHKDGSFMQVAHLGDIRVYHSGYSTDIVQQKAKRNFEMLELAAKKEAERGGAHKPLTDFYLMRENISLGRFNEAFNSFIALHRNEASVKALIPYSAITTTYFFMGLTLAGILRNRVSRADIHLNLVKLLKRLFPDYIGSDVIELLYQTNFDLKDNVFINALERLLPSYNPKSQNANSDSTKAVGTLCAKAAVICMRRGEIEKAFEYCINRILLSDIFDVDVFSILLTCIRGQPEADIIVFLNSLFDIKVTAKAHNLAEGLMQDGFQLIFKYFVMKQIENGNATKKHYIQLLILNGNYKEAAMHAESLRDFFSPELLSELIFLVLLCSEDISLFSVYKGYLNEFHSMILKHVLGMADLEGMDASATPLSIEMDADATPPVAAPLSIEMDAGATPPVTAPPSIGQATAAHVGSIVSVDEVFVYKLYNMIAFYAGLGKASQFLQLFASNSRMCFAAVSRYYIDNSMYENILFSKYRVGLDDSRSREIVLLARIQCGKYKEALAQIEYEFNECRISQNTLNQLLALIDKSGPLLANDARKLYDLYSFLFDEYTDYDDVIRTGIVFNTLNNKDKKRYAEMDLNGFDQLIRSDDKITGHLTYLMTIEQAANIYAEKGLHGMAIKCGLRLFACNYQRDKTLTNLATLFDIIGNKQLSKDLHKIKLSRS